MKKSRPEIAGRKTSIGIDDLDAFSISQFCERHGLSVATFYKLKDQMPAVFHVGNRVLISREAAQRWRAEREKAEAAA
jgi:hypothetical protein